MDFSFFQTVGYHTFEDKHPDDVKHAPFKCIDVDAYLGRGYYYWDKNLQLGKIWGGIRYKKYGKNYHVGETAIKCHRSIFFDLVGEREHQQLIVELSKSLVKRRPEKHNWPIGKMIEFLKAASSFDPDSEFYEKFNYKAIRAADTSFDKLDKADIKFAKGQGNYSELNPCYIICVIDNKEIALQPISIVHSSRK